MTDMPQRLFSYGTLQLAEVQLATFGRRLEGRADALEGFVRSTLVITDPDVLAASGQAEQPVIRPSGDPADVVEGVIFDLTEAELAAADGYETDAYARVSVRSRGGVATWVYVAA
jgi:hypothetical protein